MRLERKHIKKGNRYMKHLRIKERKGEFLRETNWLEITELTAEDILCLAKAAVQEDDFELDPYDEAALHNAAHKIIYQKISEQLLSLHARKQEFIDETRNIYQDAYEKYCNDRTDS